MSPDDRDAAFAIDESGLVCQARLEKAWAGGRASVGVQKGKYYYEITVADEGLCRVGWATSAANLDLGKDKQVRRPILYFKPLKFCDPRILRELNPHLLTLFDNTNFFGSFP